MTGIDQSAARHATRGFQGYTAEELEETAKLTRSENPRWRLVLPVTRSTREFIIDQMPALITSYWLAIALILAASSIERPLPISVIATWLVESGASIVLRIAIFRHMVRVSPVEIASSVALRLLPLLGILLAAVHWGWTATLFIGPKLNLTTVVVLLTYVMLSIACLGLAPVSPVICAAYLIPMWGATAWMLDSSDWTTFSMLLALSAALAGVLWSAFYIVVSGVRRHLVRSDEVDLLMRELRARNSEVEVLRAAAAADLETRAAVFASASHDLRQRIHALKLFAHANAAAMEVRTSMRRMASGIDELETFVTDVLQFVRYDGRAEDRLSVVPVQEMLQGIELQFEAIALQNNVNLRTRATALYIRTDAIVFCRVLENLVSNALKFTRKDVLVAARQRKGGVHVEVWDQGDGLDIERLEGDPKVRPTPSPRGQQDGFGLGLLIVRRLVEALGYRIEVRSKAQKGTLVRIVIPAQYVLSEDQK